MASRGPYWYVTVSLLQYIGKPFQARTGVFFDKSLQACRITLFSCSPWPWSRLPSRLRDRIRQGSIIKYHSKDRLSSKNSHFIKIVFLRASAPLCWLMEYSFRKKKLPARWRKGSFFRLLSRAFLLICQYRKSQFVHHKLIFDWWNAMVIKSSVFHYLLHRLSPAKLVDQLVQLAHLQNAKSESRRTRRNQAFCLNQCTSL